MSVVSIKRKIWFAFASILLVLFFSGLFSYRATSQLIASTSSLVHTHQVVATLQSVISILKDAETGQRGYLLTNEHAYLEPYEAATRKIFHALARVRELIRDNARQQDNIDQIAILAEEKLAELEQTISLNKTGNRTAAIEIMLTHNGKKMMDDLRLVIDAMSSDEQRLLRSQQQVTDSAVQVAFVVASFGSVTVFTLIGFIGFLFVREMDRHITERERAKEKLEYLAIHDSLTGLYNRKEMEQRVAGEVQRAIRYGHVVSVFMLDVDHFKSVNDTYGHRIGDAVLRDISKIIEKSIRKTDHGARYGGEEFVVIFPETALSRAEELAERLRDQIASHLFHIAGDKTIKLTVSIGIANLPEHAESWQGLLEAADKALYAAKHAGRNQVKTSVRASA